MGINGFRRNLPVRVMVYKATYTLWKTFDSVSEAARALKMDRANLQRKLRNDHNRVDRYIVKREIKEIPNDDKITSKSDSED